MTGVKLPLTYVEKVNKNYLPETQSTTTRAPSVTLRAAVTSLEKSTWPGESIRLIRKPEVVSFSCLMKAMSFSAMLKNMEMALKR